MLPKNWHLNKCSGGANATGLRTTGMVVRSTASAFPHMNLEPSSASLLPAGRQEKVTQFP